MYFTGLAKQNYFFKLVEYIFLSPPNSTYLDEFREKKYRYVVSYFIDENYPQNYLVYGLWRQGLQFVQKIRVVVQQQQ